MRDIFISHSSIDIKEVYEICDYFEKKGYSCWLSKRLKDLPPGQEYPAAITEAIDNSKIFVLVISENSIISEEVQKEVILANNRLKYGIRIYTIMLDKDIKPERINQTMDYVLAGKQVIFWCNEEERVELVKQIDATINGTGINDNAEIVSVFPDDIEVIGREKELDALDRLLNQYKNIYVYGMGGIGKTALVLAYAKRYYKTVYSGIIYLPVEKSILRTLANDEVLCMKNDTISEKRKKLSDYAYGNYKLELLEANVKPDMLLILDNCEFAADPLFERICNLNCHVIITTRRKNLFPEKYKSYEVKEIQSKTCLYKIFSIHYEDELNEKDINSLDTILADVEYHTMTTILLAKQMKYWGKRPSDYVDHEQFRIERIRHMNQMLKKDTYSNDIAIMYHRLFELFDARELTPKEKKVMKTMALLPSVGLQRYLYVEWVGGECMEAVDKLEQTGWIQKNSDKSTIALHPVIRDVVTRELEIFQEDPDIKSFVGRFIESLKNSWDDTYEQNIVKKEMALSFYYQYPEPSKNNYRDYLKIGKLLWVLNCMDISIEIQNKVKYLFIDEKGRYEESPEEAEALLQIGFTYQIKGEYDKAEEELEHAAKIYGNKFASALSHLAQAKMYVGKEDVDTIEPLLSQSLEIREKYWIGPRSEAASCHLYAKVMSKYRVHLDDAIRLEKRAYKIFSEVEPGSVSVSSAQYILGWLYVLTAEDDDDMEYGIQNLEEAKLLRLKNRNDPLDGWMDDIYLKLAQSYRMIKKYEEAREYMELLKELRIKKYPNQPSHPEILDVYKELQCLYEILGKTEEAKKCRKYLRYHE